MTDRAQFGNRGWGRRVDVDEDCRKGDDCSSALREDAYQDRGEKQKSKFHGLNLGIIKIGYMEHGSLALGVNVGIAKVDTQIGKQTGVAADVGVGPIGAKAGVGLGVDRRGLHAGVDASARVTDGVKAKFGLGANVGPVTGVESTIKAKVGPAHTAHELSSTIGSEGFNNGYEGKVGLGKLAGVGAGAHANLSDNTSFGAEANTHLADARLGAGVDVETDGNRVLRPDVNLNFGDRAHNTRLDVGAQLGPKLDVKVGGGYDYVDLNKEKQQGGEVSLGVGQSGIGFEAIKERNGSRHVSRTGFGRSYDSDKW